MSSKSERNHRLGCEIPCRDSGIIGLILLCLLIDLRLPIDSYGRSRKQAPRSSPLSEFDSGELYLSRSHCYNYSG
ncbi:MULTISPECIES: hypothetical protein [Microcoleaceae]|uniref:hypothetical protein n=1 Tax=Microcoleaceae TaxID=1892252 RepID=UPI0018829447|nr:hypothetical protein [Tychonema sp. LEGE 06208]MBE9162073.1 hypothetical protein [Tychonema sp. LEGE 06208]